ncbi:MAG: 3,4-dihydroxy-2-butanone-4-phosphate synthase [Pseudomonadota bacterium]
MQSDLSRVAEAIRTMEAGGIVVVTDDDDRENEGDLIMAAVHATPEKVAFFIRHTSGILCTPVTPEEADRLRLDPMVSRNDAPLATAFTVSVDVKHNLTTGISAEERTNTIRALANPNIGHEDFVRPGHIFPLVARDGGVLIRSGHTEAGVDLCRMAELAPVAVLAELVNDDGTVKRGAEVTAFAQEHDLPVVSIAEMIAWRQRNERLVDRVDSFALTTPAGPAEAHVYQNPFDAMHHLAVVFGDIRDGRNVLVRLHRESVVRDMFSVTSPIDGMLDRLAANDGGGVLIYLREGSVGVATDTSRPRDDLEAATNEKHGSAEERSESWREIGLGAQILKDLGVSSIRLISSRERRYIGLDGFGIEIESTETG